MQRCPYVVGNISTVQAHPPSAVVRVGHVHQGQQTPDSAGLHGLGVLELARLLQGLRRGSKS